MRKIVFLAIIIVILPLTGCGNDTTKLPEDNNKDVQILNSSMNSGVKQFTNEIVPDWLYQSLQQKFNSATTSIKQEDITFILVNLKESDKSQVAAFVSIDRVNGYFILYEFRQGKYVEVYSKSEPVYGMQVYGGGKQLLAFISGHGGTGVQENSFHVIGYTSKGYSEIWSGIAEKFMFGGQVPDYRTIGSINLTMDNQTLVYSITEELYNKIDKPDKVEQTVEIYKYDTEQEKFVRIVK